jgi:ubiquinone/menaquinone biosynthesis C-methylase UbiE
MGKFTENDTEKFYGSQETDDFYRSFWDSDGTLHWGLWNQEEDVTYVQASQRMTEFMFANSGITKDSRVLDLGCGNGNSSIWLAQKTGCEIVGIDLGKARIQNAKQKLQEYPSLKCYFQEASITNLPFEDNDFTHVWSQAVLYHVHDLKKGLQEVYRVLKDQGVFIFDDLVQPRKDISEEAKIHVYDRLFFEGKYSHESYLNELQNLGFMVVQAQDISWHLNKSYQVLAEQVKTISEKTSLSYEKMCEAIDKKELGWSFFKCEKVQDRIEWVYSSQNQQVLEQRYNSWADKYETDLAGKYDSPKISARTLASHLNDKNAYILDFGCGTGMVGEELDQLGFTNLAGVDLSARMLEQASKKGVYKSLQKKNIGNEGVVLFPKESFDAMILVGVFTYGHARPSAIYQLFSLLKVGGIFTITVRQDYLESNQEFKKVIAELNWSLQEKVEFTIFDNESMYAMVFIKVG